MIQRGQGAKPITDSMEVCVLDKKITVLARHALPTDTAALARHLLGKLLVRDMEGNNTIGRIVETEAYVIDDPACHAYRGITPRNRSLFLGVGFAYVYLCYGISFMLNVSSERAGIGAGVLLRAVEPLAGVEHLHQPRVGTRLLDLARGPGRLTSAFRIDRRHDGIDLLAPGPLWLGTDGTVTGPIDTSVRIGLTQGADAPLRFFLRGSPYLSGTRKLNARSA